MKKIFAFIVGIILINDVCAANYDFAVKCSTGQKLYYKWRYGARNYKVHIVDIVDCDEKSSGELVIPEKVTYKGEVYDVLGIADYAFGFCKGLTSVVIPNTISSISKDAFHYCTGLTSIIIPNSVTSIFDGAFENCDGLTSINIPNTVTLIGEAAFRDCDNLTSITISADATICKGAFSHCDKITHIAFVGSNRNNYWLGTADLYFTKDNIKYHVIKAKSVEIVSKFYPWTLTERREKFSHYDSDYYMGDISIPESVTCGETFDVVGIGENAFCGPQYYFDAKSLSVTIPNTIKTIGASAFAGSRLTSITIPNSVTGIGSCAFQGCENLTSVTLPNTITIIREKMFAGCKKLASVTIPYSVKEIEASAFEDCENLESIDIPYSVTKIGPYAFKKCGGRKFFVPKSVEEIGKYAFDGSIYINCEASAKGVKWNEKWNSGRKREYDYLSKEIREKEIQIHVYWNVAPSFSSFARYYVETGIKKWREKGEFERVDDWKKRITKDAHNKKIKELTQQAEDAYIAHYKEDANYSLDTYDSENETFLVTHKKYGKMLVPVPLDRAPYFREQWENVTKNTKYLIENDKIGIAGILFTLPDGSQYKYSSQASVNYEVAQVNYDFESIELDLQVNKDNSLSKGKQTITTTQRTIGISDVDNNIPSSNTKQDNTFVVVIANENYQEVAEVPYAHNDGEIFKQYCMKTIGVPEKNIRFKENATLNNIKAEINWLKNVIEAYNGEARVIFYYAGHGIPDEVQKTAYLLPVDGYGTDVSTGYKLDDLYAALGSLPSKSVTVFLDACFSGANRSGEMLASARGIAIKAKSSAPVGNMVVFSAAQGDETAYPNNDQQHGMFTYYLLKKIKETSGNVTYKELGDYVTDNVRKQSIVVNGKSQTPTVVPSATVGRNWETWKLK